MRYYNLNTHVFEKVSKVCFHDETFLLAFEVGQTTYKLVVRNWKVVFLERSINRHEILNRDSRI